MKIAPKAFLAIEHTMAGAMHAEWDRIATGVVAKLAPLIAAGAWAQAQETANRLSMVGVVQNVRPRLEELATSALIFGAHRASGDARQTVYAHGAPVPLELQTTLSLLEHHVEQDAADYIRGAVHRIIEDLKRADETAHMQKGYDPNEPRDRDGKWTDGGSSDAGSGNAGAAGLWPAAGAAEEGLRGGGGVSGGAGRLAAPDRPDLSTPLRGLPTKVSLDGKALDIGPYDKARQAAFDYAKEAGLDYHPPTEYAKVDPARATRIAAEYDKMKNDPDDPEVKAAYGAMIHECMGQWKAAMKTGLKVEFIPPGAPDPYAKSPRLMTEDVRQNNHMWVFPTLSGFGTDASFDASHNPLLGDAGIEIGGHKLVYNDVFRIVHDFFGHVKEGNGFRADGEENAWRSHSAMFTPLARRALTSETRGQNSWVNYGPYGAVNRTADAEHTHFADQKVGVMPEWVASEASGLPDDPLVRKDDVSGPQLTASGGMQEAEQGQVTQRNKKRRVTRQKVTKTEGPKTLYVNRRLQNAGDLVEWAKSQGFKFAQKPGDMHVTLCYSKTPFDWDDMEPKTDAVTVTGGPRAIHQFGDAVVLELDSPDLTQDHQDFRSAGASYDFPSYRPHVTITWEGAPKPVSQIEPYAGPLTFGPQVFKPINDDWKADHEEVRLNKTDWDLIGKLNKAVKEGGKVAASLGAQLTTSRLITLGFLSQAETQGADLYQIDEVLDEKTCPVCIYMNGKTFSVAREKAKLTQALTCDDPEDLKTIAPWPSMGDLKDLYAMDLDGLQSEGLGSPPFHPNCRGMLALVGTVEETIPLGGPDQDAIDGIFEAAADQNTAAIYKPVEPAQGEAEGMETANPVDPTLSRQGELFPFGVEGVEEAEPDLEEDPPPPAPSTTLPAASVADAEWTADEVARLAWARFKVTDPSVFAEVDNAYEAGHYGKAKTLINDFLTAKGEEAVKEDDFEGPNAPRQKRKVQRPAGRPQEHDDMTSDSSSIAFDSGVANLNMAPLDRD